MTPLVSNLQTDRSNRLCSFTVNLDEIDIGSKLNELSQVNTHVAGWSLIKQEPVGETTVSEEGAETQTPFDDQPTSDPSGETTVEDGDETDGPVTGPEESDVDT